MVSDTSCSQKATHSKSRVWHNNPVNCFHPWYGRPSGEGRIALENLPESLNGIKGGSLSLVSVHTMLPLLLEKRFFKPAVFLVEFLANDIALDLVRPFVNLKDFGVPHHLFYRVILHVSITT